MDENKGDEEQPDIENNEIKREAPKTYLDNTWKRFVEGIQKMPVNEDGHVSCGNLLAGLMKEKLELFGDCEDQSQLDAGMLKPIMPYEVWMPNLFPWMDINKKEKYRWRHHESLEPKQINWKNLNTHLAYLGSAVATPIFTNADNEFKTQMESIFEKVVTSLRTDFKLFEDCKLHFTGSVYEGLKIGGFDEFDYMVEIPALANVISFERGMQHQSIKLTLNDDCILNDIPLTGLFTSENEKEECSSSTERAEQNEDRDHHEQAKNERILSGNDSSNALAEDSESNDSNEIRFILVLKSLEAIIEDRIKQYLPKDWKITRKETVQEKELSLYMMYSQKSAFTYIFDAGRRKVSVDVALAVPVHDLALVSKYEGMLGSKPGNFQHQVQKRNTLHHVIIRNANTCRITFSINEKAIMNRYRDDDPRKLCIRLLKYFRDTVTIQLKSSEKEASPILNSYHIKTLFYFLFAKYKLDTDWSMETLAPRLLEAVLSLKKCFEESTLESYFIPHYNVLRNVKFLQNSSCGINDTKVLQEQLKSIYNILMASNETIDGYEDIIKYIDATRSTNIRNVSLEEERERLRLAFICTNFN